MGTDIHFYVEHLDGSDWRRAEELDTGTDGKIRCSRCDMLCVAYADAWMHESNADQYCLPDMTEFGVPVRRSWFTDRSYRLFAVLSGHLNPSYLTFFDADGNEHQITPIAAMRGLPADVSDEVRFHATSEEAHGHSHSHLSIGELLGFDWNQTTYHEALALYRPQGSRTHAKNRREALRREQARLDRHGGPPGYPFVIDRQDPRPDPAADRLVWTEPLSRTIPVTFFGALLRMSHLAAGDLNNVRCVFWFEG